MFFGGKHDGSDDRNVLCCSFLFKSWSNFKHLKNQTAIKLALAFTDLLTGLFVFPSMFVINHFAYFRGMEFRGFYDCVEESPFGLSRGFVNFFGFFQIFTITIFWGELVATMFCGFDIYFDFLKIGVDHGQKLLDADVLLSIVSKNLSSKTIIFQNIFQNYTKKILKTNHPSSSPSTYYSSAASTAS